MAFDFKAALKKKWVRYALAVIAVVGALLIFKSRMGGSSAQQVNATGLDDAQAADLTQESEQAASIQASAAAQASSQSFQASQQQESDQTALAALGSNNATQISLAGITLQGIQDQITGQTTQQQNQINGQVSLANIAAQEQDTISNNQTQVETTQINQNAAVQNAYFGVMENQATNNANTEQTLLNDEMNTAKAAGNATTEQTGIKGLTGGVLGAIF